MVYSNIFRPRKGPETLKAQMEIMAWSQADCGLKCCTSQILDLPFSLKLEKDTHQHTVHIPEKIWTFLSSHQEAAKNLDSQGFQFTWGEYASQTQRKNWVHVAVQYKTSAFKLKVWPQASATLYLQSWPVRFFRWTGDKICRKLRHSWYIFSGRTNNWYSCLLWQKVLKSHFCSSRKQIEKTQAQ